MINRNTRLRWRRKFRSRRQQVEDISVHAEVQLEKHFFKRLTRLFVVRRFVSGWILLLILLAGIVSIQLQSLGGYYQELRPVPGGTYTEGMIGTFTNASPLYATGLVDTTVSRLIFSGLLKYDASNRLVGDLAESWQVTEAGKLYTVKLRQNLKWHDNTALTADDVVFTFQTIKNPDAKSPLFRAWQEVSVKAVDTSTVTFTLPNTLAPFLYGLTTGIVPKHKLDSIPPAQLRSASFNTASPIGAGPFSWEAIETIGDGGETNQQNIGLKAFDNYHNGKPKLQRFVIKTFSGQERLVSSFQSRSLNGLVGMDRTPDVLLGEDDIGERSIPLTAETLVFLRTDSPILKDVKVRQALIQSVDVPSIIKGLSYPAIVSDEPLLHGQLGYNYDLRQLPTNIAQANKLLDEAGWKRQANDQTRTNDKHKLSLKLFASNNPDYAYITQRIQKAWQALGVQVQVTLPNDDELQPVVTGREYDALIYGVSIGTDPDVFAYWHSSQAHPNAPSRLNLSNYKSATADRALEGGRTRLEPDLRTAKYIPFLQSWRNDVPAIALYQPRFLYITRGQLFGFEPKVINSAADRFNNVENWMIRQDQTLR